LGGSKAVFGGFDSHALPPVHEQTSVLLTNTSTLLTGFLQSRRQGLSPRSCEFYKSYLNLARPVIGLNVTPQRIIDFLGSLTCSNGGKHAYFRTLRVFYNWLYSPKSGYNLDPRKNPILQVEAPKVERKILPALTSEQVEYLIEQAGCVRDKAIISLFVDSSLRLSELADICPRNIDWDNRVIKVVFKGNKEGFAPFGERTKKLLQEWLAQYKANGRLWDLNVWCIV
jgi:site-specific recombinase XerD